MEFNANRYYYLSGMPRTGSTLLGSLLYQHPDVHVSSTSPLNLIMHDLYESLQNNAFYGIDWDINDMNQRIFKYMFNCWYEPIKEKYIFDKSRGWGFNIHAVQAYINKNPKILITYRPIPEILTSFITLIDKDPKNHVDLHLFNNNKEINTRNRAEFIWDSFKDFGYQSTVTAIENFGDLIHIVKYDDLVNNTEQTMSGIWKYLEIDAPIHDFNCINTYLPSADENWGTKNLHVVRPKIEKISRDPREILGDELFEYYSTFNILEENHVK
jgi:sulfotransferase